MEISPITTDAGMLSMVRQIETSTAVQTSVLKTMADNQQEMAEMLHEIGVGQKLDIRT